MDDDIGELLHRVAAEATLYLDGIGERPVGATASDAEVAARLPERLPDAPVPAGAVLEELLQATADGIVATGSPRYFGFVIGNALPAAIAADWMATVWDQNAGLHAGGPAAAVIEQTAGRWLLDVLELPPTSSFAIVTGCQMAHVTCLAAARHRVLADQGWDVERDGLNGTPPVRVLAGARSHVTVSRALRLLGFGTAAIEMVDVDDHARMRPDALADTLGDDGRPTIVCTQLGEVNNGAMDPVGALADVAHAAGAWVHVDGAFGLWARASTIHRHLTLGVEHADSWATDGHKWLNVPYDCGLAFCAHPDDHRGAMGVRAAYLIQSDDDRRDAMDWTPEFSRRARGTSLYAALRTLGRTGIADVVDRCCDYAQQFAKALDALDGAEVLGEVALNQVLVAFGDDERTAAVLDAVQASGECWMSGTTWDGRFAMRISIVGYRTTAADVDRSVTAIAQALKATA